MGDIVRGDFVLGGYCPGDIVRGGAILGMGTYPTPFFCFMFSLYIEEMDLSTTSKIFSDCVSSKLQ